VSPTLSFARGPSLTLLLLQRMAVTEGVNLRGCWSFGHGVVDLNQIYTNDVGAILRTYGVEAARKSIIKEMSGVFSVYGIGVDYRHLTVIADYMVRPLPLSSLWCLC
jgi:DNA-directed RNA polymerase I subunit RPA1